jgi:hypothetical protein
MNLNLPLLCNIEKIKRINLKNGDGGLLFVVKTCGSYIFTNENCNISLNMKGNKWNMKIGKNLQIRICPSIIKHLHIKNGIKIKKGYKIMDIKIGKYIKVYLKCNTKVLSFKVIQKEVTGPIKAPLIQKDKIEYFDWLIQLLDNALIYKYLEVIPKTQIDINILFKEYEKLIKGLQTYKTGREPEQTIFEINNKQYFLSALKLPKTQSSINDIIDFKKNIVKSGEDVLNNINVMKFISFVDLRKYVFNNGYFDLLRELIILSQLNFFNIIDSKTSLPVCKNFIRTFYITALPSKINTSSYEYVYRIFDLYENDISQIFKEFAEKEKEKFKLLFKGLIFQVVYALYCADEWFGFKHNDLHEKNILIKKIKENDFDTDSHLFYFDGILKFDIKHKDCPYIVKIIDFDKSSINKPNYFINEIKDLNKRNLLNMLFDNLLSYHFDIKRNINFKDYNNIFYDLHYLLIFLKENGPNLTKIFFKDEFYNYINIKTNKNFNNFYYNMLFKRDFFDEFKSKENFPSIFNLKITKRKPNAVNFISREEFIKRNGLLPKDHIFDSSWYIKK